MKKTNRETMIINDLKIKVETAIDRGYKQDMLIRLGEVAQAYRMDAITTGEYDQLVGMLKKAIGDWYAGELLML